MLSLHQEWAGNRVMADMNGRAMADWWRRGGGIYPVGFFNCLGCTGWWTALPFIIVHLGGSDADVGWCFGFYTGMYLVGCLLAHVLLAGLNPKKLVQIGFVGCIGTVIGFAVILVLAERGWESGPLIAVNIVAVLFGLAQSLTCPFMFSWISSGYEGSALSRRMGRSMSITVTGGLVGPAVAGVLVEQGHGLPMMMCLGAFVISLVGACLTPGPSGGDTSGVVSRTEPELLAPVPERLRSFLWISRIGLLAAVICSVLIRVQAPLLMTLELEFSALTFGLLVTVLGGSAMAVHVINMKVSAWHYRVVVFVILSLFSPAGMVIVFFATELWMFFVAAVLVGFGMAFLFASHMFYGAEGSCRRSARMVIHEIIMGVGMVIGSVVGGNLGEHVDRRAPYRFALIFVVITAAVQLCVWFLARTPRRQQSLELDRSGSPRDEMVELVQCGGTGDVHE